MAIRCETYERIATYLDCMDCDLKPKCRNGKVDVVANDLTSQRRDFSTRKRKDSPASNRASG